MSQTRYYMVMDRGGLWHKDWFKSDSDSFTNYIKKRAETSGDSIVEIDKQEYEELEVSGA